jgi:NifU-like protein involved in Fe-S cluster formation
MKKENNILPTVEEAKQRIELYNNMKHAMRDLSHDEKKQVLLLLTKYLDLMEGCQLMEKRISLVYNLCAVLMFEYLYKAGQLSADNNHFHPVIRKHINDILITLANDYETD